MSRSSRALGTMLMVLFTITMFRTELAAQNAEQNTRKSERHYAWCMKTAHYLQVGYNHCKTDRCHRLVTKVFDLWQKRCF